VSTQRNDVPVLNGLRCLAVLIVFASHASNIFYGGKITGWGGGQLGVMLFFMLSGFLMAYLYAGNPASISEQWKFVVNRFARIYPLFAVVVFACFVIHRFAVPIWAYRIVSPHDVVEHLLFVRGYNIFWTIGPEVFFYLLFLILWRAYRSSVVAFVAVVVAALGVAWLPVSVVSSNSLARLHDTLPYFLAGTFLGLRSEQLLAFARQGSRWPLLAFWVSLSVFALSFPEVIRLFAEVPKRLTGDPWPDPWSFPFYLLASGCLFVASILASPWLLANRVAGFLGKISFSFYLLHYAVIENVKDWFPGCPVRAIAVAFVVTTALSACTYGGIEAPMRRLVRRVGAFGARPERAPSA
jgi:peptidoglycan/LPS O-acetylase OafA/YrhL